MSYLVKANLLGLASALQPLRLPMIPRPFRKSALLTSELLALSLSVTAILLTALVGWGRASFSIGNPRNISADNYLKEHRVTHSNLLPQQSAVEERSRSPLQPFIEAWESFHRWRHSLQWAQLTGSEEVSIDVPPPVLPELLAEAKMAGAPIVFTDIAADHWAKPVLDDLSARGIIGGLSDGSFRPNRPITRAELAVQIAQVFEFSMRSASAFEDVPASHWAYSAIQKSVQMGFLTGYPQGRFEPSQTLSRAEVLVAIASGLNLSPSLDPNSSLQPFHDREAVPDWAIAPVTATLEAGIGIMPTNPHYLAPNRAATRLEVAIVLHQALVYLGQLDPLSVSSPEDLSSNPGQLGMPGAEQNQKSPPQ